MKLADSGRPLDQGPGAMGEGGATRGQPHAGPLQGSCLKASCNVLFFFLAIL